MKKAKTILLISALLLTFIVTKQINVMQVTQEIWKDIPGYNGLYQASSFGFIKSFKGKTPHTIGFVGWKGYMYAILRNGRQNQVLIHRIVAQLFIDNPDNKPEVNHKDGVKWNNHASNLEWCTGKENLDHAYNAGLLTKRYPKNRGVV